MNNDKKLKERLFLKKQRMWRRSEALFFDKVVAEYQVQSVLELKYGESLLDFGCGDGSITAKLAPYFGKIVGIDSSQENIAIAKRNVHQGEFHVGLFEEFVYPARFDTICALNVFEHVKNPVRIFEIAGDLLSNKGRLIVQVPNALSICRRIAKEMGVIKDYYQLSDFDIMHGHRRNYDSQTLVRHAEKAGLKILCSGGLFYKLLSTSQMSWFLTHANWRKSLHGWAPDNSKDWAKEFCRASYELGKERPEDCTLIYVCCTRNTAKSNQK